MFGQQSDTDFFSVSSFCCWTGSWRHPALKAYTKLTRDCFLIWISQSIASKKGFTLRIRQAFIHSTTRRLLSTQRVNYFGQVLKTSVCCPHKSFIVFRHILSPHQKNCTNKLLVCTLKTWLKCKCGSTASTFVWTQMPIQEFGKEKYSLNVSHILQSQLFGVIRDKSTKWVMS